MQGVYADRTLTDNYDTVIIDPLRADRLIAYMRNRADSKLVQRDGMTMAGLGLVEINWRTFLKPCVIKGRHTEAAHEKRT